jgi:hypothetical protein
MAGKAPKAPPAPDPVATAQAQAQYNQQTAAQNFDLSTQTARQNATRDRVNQTNPFGSITYKNDPNNPDQWSVDQSLSPEMAAKLQQVYSATSQPVDLASIGATQDTAAKALLGRLQPGQDQQRQALETRLRNQGIMPGSDAWTNGMRDVSQSENDARLAALGSASNEANSALSRYMTARQAPLNEFQALMGGAGPMGVASAQQGQTQQAQTDYLGAVQMQQQAQQNAFNNKNANYQANLAGLYSIGSAAAGAGGKALYGGK